MSKEFWQTDDLLKTGSSKSYYIFKETLQESKYFSFTLFIVLHFLKYSWIHRKKM